MAENQIPNCSQELCKQLSRYIQQRCMDSRFPPGTPIPVITKDGPLCYCYCGGQPQSGIANQHDQSIEPLRELPE
jgi:hypothetical protein